MHAVKVCVYDEDERFAKQLAACLNRQGEGNLFVTAVTDAENLWEYMGRHPYDILLAGNPELLLKIKQVKENIQIIWLREEERPSSVTREVAEAASVSRYAGVRRIGQMVEMAANHVHQLTKQSVPVAAIYSPVGRCGKTAFAMEVADNPERRWMYIGMEDYGIFRDGKEDAGDAFLYYIKERNPEMLFQLVKNCQGILPSAFSPFDSKLLDFEDWKWSIETMRQLTDFWGVLFDVGTGVLQEVSWLMVFDYVIVPYLKEEQALRKKEKFEALLKACGLEEDKERFQFVDMGNEEEIRKKKQEMGCG